VSEPVARSPLVLVGWNERMEALTADCGAIDWKCVGDRAGDRWDSIGGSASWGSVEPGLDDVETDATALLIGGQAATDYFDGADFASNDFDGSGFRDWWDDLLEAVPNFPAMGGTVLDQMLAAGPSSYDIVGATEAHAVPTVQGSRDSDRVTVSYPSQVATADVVLAPVVESAGGRTLADLADDERLTAALLAAGWRVDGAELPPDVATDVELPADNGLPRPGVLEALREL
jgi:hypothetical protein